MTARVYHTSDLIDYLVDAVDGARAMAGDDSRWQNAITAAYDWLLQEQAILFDTDTHALHVASPSGRSYRANGACQCKAYELHAACWHRAAARLVRRCLDTRSRLESAFLAPSNYEYELLSPAEQALFWTTYDSMDRLFNQPAPLEVVTLQPAQIVADAQAEDAAIELLAHNDAQRIATEIMQEAVALYQRPAKGSAAYKAQVNAEMAELFT